MNRDSFKARKVMSALKNLISLEANHQKPSKSFNHVLEIVRKNEQQRVSCMLNIIWIHTCHFRGRYEMLTTEDCWTVEQAKSEAENNFNVIKFYCASEGRMKKTKMICERGDSVNDGWNLFRKFRQTTLEHTHQLSRRFSAIDPWCWMLRFCWRISHETKKKTFWHITRHQWKHQDNKSMNQHDVEGASAATRFSGETFPFIFLLALRFSGAKK